MIEMRSAHTGRRPPLRVRRLTGLALFCVALCGQMSGMPALSQGAPRSAPGGIVFSIPRQPLADALIAFSRVAHKDVLYDSALARGRTSSAVQGSFLPGDALNRILAGTGLVERYADASSFVVLPVIDGNVPGETTRPIQGSVIALDTMHVDHPKDFRVYSGLIKAELQQALQKDARTRSGKIKTRVNIWIDGMAHVHQVTLMASAANARRNADIIAVLEDVSFSQPPPPDLPQPVIVSIDIEPL